MEWALPDPFVIDIHVTHEAIDAYQHVNNGEYLRWVEQVSWAHSEALGLSLERYRALDRAMVVHRHELDYLAPGFVNDHLQLATWIVASDGRFSLTRRFQLKRVSDGKTLLNARTRFACVALSSGRPKRLPDEYQRIYGGALVAASEIEN
ncbi:thioesterase family protein [Halomonas sp. M1]|uniref:acyl-CoA thioesterase n=1 Tax=Halomonas sp. M1 TaxID=3035470 RepID=UPI002485FEE0|nr:MULTISPECIES: thioesterase family protein [unclassified Halomonas]MDP3536265.1 thioesterase family protein [Halomonas sp.]WFE70868.1 thioesterase family protein [Halomonas sp. M1]